MHGGPEGLTLNPDQRIVLFEMIDTNKSFLRFKMNPQLYIYLFYSTLIFRLRLSLFHSTQDGDVGGVGKITKKSLNSLTGKRTISIQEAAHDIGGFDLTICSEILKNVNLNSALKCSTDNKNAKSIVNRRDLVDSYRNRSESMEGLSLEQYFYNEFLKSPFFRDPDTSRKKARILVPTGMKCTPKFPVDYNYAKAMLVLHVPWSCRHPLDIGNQSKTIALFKSRMDDNLFPLHVKSEYERAVRYSQEYEIEKIVREGVIGPDSNNDKDSDDNDYEDDIAEKNRVANRHACAMTERGQTLNDQLGGGIVSIGIDHDWTESFFDAYCSIYSTHGNNINRDRDLTVDGREYMNNIVDKYYNEGLQEELNIPKRGDGSEYKLSDLNEEQRAIVYASIDTIVKFINNDKDYKPLRATILGCGGTGKSFIINTIIAIVRQYTQCNDSVLVAAPSGGAAFNVGGCTIHRSLGVEVSDAKKMMNLDENKKTTLIKNLKHLLCLIIDERSQLGSKTFSTAERNVRQCIYGQQNISEYWGGLPVVLLFGDDYQQFPVSENGAIQGYAKTQGLQTDKIHKATSASMTYQLLEAEGTRLLVEDMIENVFILTKNHRVEDRSFKEVLKRLRVGEATDDDAERLFSLHENNYDKFGDWIENIKKQPDTLWLFTRNIPKNEKNMEMLEKVANETKVHVARMDCHFKTNKTQYYGAQYASISHFETPEKIVTHNDICIGAKVCISGLNYIPEIGLYNGARGTVVDMKFSTMAGPNNKYDDHLPEYVVVDFPHLKLPSYIQPWDRLHPTVRIHLQ